MRNSGLKRKCILSLVFYLSISIVFCSERHSRISVTTAVKQLKLTLRTNQFKVNNRIYLYFNLTVETTRRVTLPITAGVNTVVSARNDFHLLMLGCCCCVTLNELRRKLLTGTLIDTDFQMNKRRSQTQPHIFTTKTCFDRRKQ